MKILIVGASKGTGFEVVKRALELGHEVTAVSRTGSDALLADSRLTWAEADAKDLKRMMEIMPGHNAVIVTLGMKPSDFRSESTLFSDSIAAIITSMQHQDVHKLVIQSALGVGESRRAANPLFKVVASLLLKAPYKDHERQEQLAKDATNIDWIIVRPSGLTNGKRVTTYKVRPETKKVPMRISRASVADFMIHACESNEYNNQSVNLGGV